MTGANCTSETGISVSVDVILEQGWNQLTWDFVLEKSLTVGDRPMSEPVFSVVVACGDEL